MRNFRQWLEYQSDRIEAVMSAHGKPVFVSGGMVKGASVVFDLQPFPCTTLADVQAAIPTLCAALSTDLVHIRKHGKVIQLGFAHGFPVTSQAAFEQPIVMLVVGVNDEKLAAIARYRSG